MTITFQHFRTIVLAVAMLAAGLFVADSAVNAGAAEARCNGRNNPVTSTYSQGGVVRVRETPVSGTCNGNNFYQGVLVDAATDGNTVGVNVQDGNGGYRRIATTGTSVQYGYTDVNGTSNSNMMLCADPSYGCGWGSTRGAHGANHGY